MPKYLIKLAVIFFLGIASIQPVLAQSGTPTATTASPGASSATTTPTGGVGSVVRQVGGQTQLPSYDAGHANQSYQLGASQLTSTIYFILDFFKYILGGIAVLMIVISGVKLIISGRAVEDAMSREKETLRYSFSGLIIILLADQLVRNVFFGQEGEVYRTGTDMQLAAEQGVKLVSGLSGLIRVFLPSVAILFFVIAGFRLLTSRGDTEKVGKAKTQISWAIGGLVLAGLAEVVVFRVLFPQQGSTIPDPYEFARLIITMTNFITGFISTIAVTMIIYAGYLYVVSLGGEGLDKAKKILVGAIVGLLIAMAAFGLVNTFVKVEPLKTTPPPQEVIIPNT